MLCQIAPPNQFFTDYKCIPLTSLYPSFTFHSLALPPPPPTTTTTITPPFSQPSIINYYISSTNHSPDPPSTQSKPHSFSTLE